jgi:hypothetical protein
MGNVNQDFESGFSTKVVHRPQTFFSVRRHVLSLKILFISFRIQGAAKAAVTGFMLHIISRKRN